MNYRPDIDGLRCLAVLAVVLFHIDLLGVTGGYVGVDIFFVISGYLITSIILSDLEQGRFSFAVFYARRARRILPMLFTVMLASAAAGYVMLLPQDFERLGKSLAAASLFGSNILFWREAGYFDAAGHMKPLLHTWSLGVEEQFYLLFPLYVWVLFKYARRWLVPLTVLGALASLSVAEWGIMTGRADASFYLLPTRAWELAAGSFLAFGILKPPARAWQNLACAALGLALIAYACFAYESGTDFPGLHALPPVLGTALLIYAGSGAGGNNALSRLIGVPVMAYGGRLSYSLYLWHWPVIVFWQYYLIETPGAAQKWMMLALSFALAIASYHLLEKPFKHLKMLERAERRKAFALTAGVSAVFLLAGIVLWQQGGMPHRFNQTVLNLAQVQRGEEWMPANIPDYADESWIVGDEAAAQYSFLIWGDSHATVMTPAITPHARDLERKGLLMTKAGCLPSVKDDTDHLHPLCVYANKRIFDILDDNPGIDTVFLIARWSAYPRWWNGADEARDYSVLTEHINLTIQALKERSLRIIFVQDVPNIHKDVPSILGRAAIQGRDIDIRLGFDRFMREQGPVGTEMKEIARQAGVIFISPQDILCDTEYCHVTKEGKSLYLDTNHLSRHGAQQLIQLYDTSFKH